MATAYNNTGDVNGDGFEDLIVSIVSIDPNVYTNNAM